MSSCSGSIMVYAMMLMSFMFHLVCQETTHFFFLILWFLSKIDSSLSMHHWELVARIGAFTFLLWAIPEWWLSRAHPPSASPSHRSLKPVLSTSGIHRCPSAVSSASRPHQPASVSTAVSFLPGPHTSLLILLSLSYSADKPALGCETIEIDLDWCCHGYLCRDGINWTGFWRLWMI